MRQPDINLRSVNLNLLPILDSLLQTPSVSASASELHMSQSAVSDALARLRVQFRDQLLVRRGREMSLTPLAKSMITPVRDITERTQQLIALPEFDPATLTREFVVATADPVVMTIGAELLKQLHANAPSSSVRFVDLRDNVYDSLRALEIDLVIVPRGFLRAEQLHEEPLYEEPFVCIARRNHPRIGKHISRKLYSSLSHVSYRADAKAETGMEASLIGLAQQDIIKVPSFSLLPMIVEQTDAIALVQKRVAKRFETTADIALFAPPVRIEPLKICAYWSAGHAQNRAHTWFRNLLSDIACALP